VRRWKRDLHDAYDVMLSLATNTVKKLVAEGIDPSVERKEERRNARIARANTLKLWPTNSWRSSRENAMLRPRSERSALALGFRRQGVRQPADRADEGARNPRRVAEN